VNDVGTGAGVAHPGASILGALGQFGVRELFTLNGSHIWAFYDAARQQGWPIYDTRHEATATFAAEGMAKLTRRPGVAALTAGPGVTNGLSAVAGASFLGSPLVVLGGRAQQSRWGSGGLQEFDHVPVVAPITKWAATVFDGAEAGRMAVAAATAAMTPHRGPVFLDVPFDVVFTPVEAEVPAAPRPRGAEPDPADVEATARLLASAERPALLVGSDVYWAGAWSELQEVAEAFRVPVYANGLGRGCLPADHDLAFTRTRGLLKTEADLVVVIGTPLDFRVSFGRFGEATVVHVVDDPAGRATHVTPAVSPAGDLRSILEGLAAWAGDRVDRGPWLERLGDAERRARAADDPDLAADTSPIRPSRVYGELRKVLDRDAVVICDGGDFASYAGRYVDSYEPGCWLDPGPYGCLGTGLGYAMAARVAHADRQVVALLGDGAAGFSLMDVDSLVRHRLPVVLVVGNNGVWGLEKHPMQFFLGWDEACDLQPETRYDEVVRALGGAGETVREPGELGPALSRALAADAPYLLNVLTDPTDAYPRSSDLS
jgi:acetolactate synthase I/II/III large subunit